MVFKSVFKRKLREKHSAKFVDVKGLHESVKRPDPDAIYISFGSRDDSEDESRDIRSDSNFDRSDMTYQTQGRSVYSLEDDLESSIGPMSVLSAPPLLSNRPLSFAYPFKKANHCDIDFEPAAQTTLESTPDIPDNESIVVDIDDIADEESVPDVPLESTMEEYHEFSPDASQNVLLVRYASSDQLESPQDTSLELKQGYEITKVSANNLFRVCYDPGLEYREDALTTDEKKLNGSPRAELSQSSAAKNISENISNKLFDLCSHPGLEFSLSMDTEMFYNPDRFIDHFARDDGSSIDDSSSYESSNASQADMDSNKFEKSSQDDMGLIYQDEEKSPQLKKDNESPQKPISRGSDPYSPPRDNAIAPKSVHFLPDKSNNSNKGKGNSPKPDIIPQMKPMPQSLYDDLRRIDDVMKVCREREFQKKILNALEENEMRLIVEGVRKRQNEEGEKVLQTSSVIASSEVRERKESLSDDSTEPEEQKQSSISEESERNVQSQSPVIASSGGRERKESLSDDTTEPEVQKQLSISEELERNVQSQSSTHITLVRHDKNEPAFKSISKDKLEFKANKIALISKEWESKYDSKPVAHASLSRKDSKEMIASEISKSIGRRHVKDMVNIFDKTKPNDKQTDKQASETKVKALVASFEKPNRDKQGELRARGTFALQTTTFDDPELTIFEDRSMEDSDDDDSLVGLHIQESVDTSIAANLKSKGASERGWTADFDSIEGHTFKRDFYNDRFNADPTVVKRGEKSFSETFDFPEIDESKWKSHAPALAPTTDYVMLKDECRDVATVEIFTKEECRDEDEASDIYSMVSVD